MSFAIRRAILDDIDLLRPLMERSVRELQRGDYTGTEIDLALASVYGVDTQLIKDGSYYVAETRDSITCRGTTASAPLVVGCGGWSKRRTLFGGDQFSGREAAELDPKRDAAKIRAFFVHPDWARRGIGSLILDACERAAFAAGFTRLEMGATLTGVPFYRARGYVERERLTVDLAPGESLAIVRMEKAQPSPSLQASAPDTLR